MNMVEKNINTSTEDYALESVPLEKRQSLYSTAAVYGGWSMSVFDLILGGILGTMGTFWEVLIAIVLGNCFIAIVGTLTGYLGCKYGLTGHYFSRATFGKRAQILPAIGISLALPGFVGTYTGTVGQTINQLIPSIPWYIVSLIFLSCIVLSVWHGFKGLAALGWVAVPLLAIISILGVFKTGGLEQVLAATPVNPTSMTVLISSVISGWIVGGALSPDVARYAKKQSHVGISNFLGWVVFAGGLELVGAITMLASGESDFISHMIKSGYTIPALLLYILLMWTTANSNLYSFTLSWANIEETLRSNKKRLPRNTWTIVGATIVLIIAYFVVTMGVDAYLNRFLSYVGILVPAYAGVLIADFYLVRKVLSESTESFIESFYKLPNIRWSALIGLACGMLAAGLVNINVPKEVIGIFTAGLIYIVVEHLSKGQLVS